MLRCKRMKEQIDNNGEIDLSKWLKYGCIAVLIIFIFAIFNPIVIIPAGNRGVVLRFGAVEDRIFGEGIHVITPIMETVVQANVQTQKFEIKASAATQDLLDVTTTVAVNYHIAPESTNKLYQDVGPDFQAKVISPAVQETVKATTAQFDATKLITERPAVKDKIEEALKERLASRGIIIETISITDFTFPTAFNDAITAKQTAVQKATEAENKLAQVQFEAQQSVATAKGQAESIDIINKQLEKSPTYIQYLATTKWDGKLPLATSGATPFIQLPA